MERGLRQKPLEWHLDAPGPRLCDVPPGRAPQGCVRRPVLQDAPPTGGKGWRWAGPVHVDAGRRQGRHDEVDEGRAGLHDRALHVRPRAPGRQERLWRPLHDERRRRKHARGGGYVRRRGPPREQPGGLPRGGADLPWAGGAGRLPGPHDGRARRVRQRPEQARQPDAEHAPVRIPRAVYSRRHLLQGRGDDWQHYGEGRQDRSGSSSAH
mmetsp:Transcript_114149/g.323815  ORF Transcript_114149/g.323815 Transcript_114149/m.323815 type:complete len:210 (+) Transcript_114149:3510-4139(+)